MAVKIFLFGIGLAVGSFLNVCIYRLPRGESVVRPRSFCPKCGQRIAWFDNIPVLSFFLLRGRCRHCHRRISLRYPAVELASGLMWYGSWTGDEGSVFFWIQVVLLSLLLVASVADFETGIIPDEVNFLGIVTGLVISFFYPKLHQSSTGLISLGKSGVGLVAGGGLIYVTGVIGNWIFRKESMGGGDVKLMAMVGSFLGWEKGLLTFFTAPFFALPFALYRRWIKKEETFPYGPFLSLAAAVQFFYGEAFWRHFVRF